MSSPAIDNYSPLQNRVLNTLLKKIVCITVQPKFICANLKSMISTSTIEYFRIQVENSRDLFLLLLQNRGTSLYTSIRKFEKLIF